MLVLSPGTARVDEQGGAHIEKLEGLPRAVEALFQRQQRVRLSRLIAQWIAAQSRISAQRQLSFGIEIRCEGSGERGKEYSALGLPQVRATVHIENAVVQLTAFYTAPPPQRVDQVAPMAKVQSILQCSIEDQRVACGAKSGGRESNLHPSAAPQINIFCPADLIEIARAQVVVLQNLDADPGVGKRARLGNVDLRLILARG